MNGVLKGVKRAFFWAGMLSLGGIFVLPLVGLLALILILAGIAAMLLLGVCYLTIVFFCCTRYSLKELLCTVLAGGLGVSLMLQENLLFLVLGMILLVSTVSIVANHIANSDPNEHPQPRSRSAEQLNP